MVRLAMNAADPQFFIFTLALVGIVIIIAALLSGLIDKSDVPQVGVFLALGAILGPAGLGLLDVTLDSPILFVVATLSLTLVLFTDAVSLPIAEVRRNARLAFIVLGPGTVLSAALIALAGWDLLDLSPAAAAVLGAALASTDPVMLRGLVRRSGLSDTVRPAPRAAVGSRPKRSRPPADNPPGAAVFEQWQATRYPRLGAARSRFSPARPRCGYRRRAPSARGARHDPAKDRRPSRLRIALFAGRRVRRLCRRGGGPRQRIYRRVHGRAHDRGARSRSLRLLSRVRRDDRRDGAAVRVRALRQLAHLDWLHRLELARAAPGDFGRAHSRYRFFRGALHDASQVEGVSLDRMVRAARLELAAAHPGSGVRRRPGKRLSFSHRVLRRAFLGRAARRLADVPRAQQAAALVPVGCGRFRRRRRRHRPSRGRDTGRGNRRRSRNHRRA